MAEQREHFLRSTEDPDPDDFLHFMVLHRDKSNVFDAVETTQTFDRKSLDQLWNGLQYLCTSVLFSFNADEDVESQEECIKKVSSAIDGILLLANTTLDMKDSGPIPDGLYQTIVILHNMLNIFPEVMCKMKDGIAKLCEKWWSNDLPGKNNLVSQTVLYLLKKVADPNVKGADIKRVWQLHEALQQFDFGNQSFMAMKNLLLHCFMLVPFIKCDEGRKFLTFLFTLNLDFIDEVHVAIKNQIPCCPRSLLVWYGEIYFKAWKSSEGAYCEKIEKVCIQDLMYRAVQAIHSPKNMALILRKLLGYFHKQKKQTEVEEMLLRLYSPIIWRSVLVANVYVRANAASLLVEVFPLRDPTANVEQTDNLIQKQLDTLQTLLEDPCPNVRTIAVTGVCKICNLYWELIPVTVISNFLKHLIQVLACDASSADVRVAVFRGIPSLLDNYLSHPLLNDLLPKLQLSIHDSSEKVRIAFIDLLLKVKCLRAIRVWSIVPVAHILVRLELDGAPIIRRIVRLLLSSFLPQDKPNDALLKRCIVLIQTNSRAARVFYHYVHQQVPVQVTEQYILVIVQCLLSCVNKMLSAENDSQDTGSDDEEDEEEEEVLSVDDIEIMVGLVETVTILYAGIMPELSKPANAGSKTILEAKLARAIPKFLRAFNDANILSALCLLAGFIPADAVPLFSRTCLPKLRSFDVEASSDQYGSLLETMCSWGKASQVLDLIIEWLDQAFTPAKKTVKKSKKRVSFSNDASPSKPILGLKYLAHILSQFQCQHTVLEANKQQVEKIQVILRSSMSYIVRVIPKSGKDNGLSVELLRMAFEYYCKITIFLHPEEEGLVSDVLPCYEHMLTWAGTDLLILLSDEKSNRGRKSSITKNENLKTLACDVLEILLKMSRDLLLLGLGNADFSKMLANLVSKVIKLEEKNCFLKVSTSILCQIVDANLNQHWNLDDAVVATAFSDLLQALARSMTDNPDSSTITAQLKSIIGEAYKSYYLYHQTDKITDNEVMATTMVAVMTDVTQRVKREEEIGDTHTLPPLAAILLDIVCRKKHTSRLFLEEIHQCLTSDAVIDLKSYAAVVQILNCIQKGQSGIAGMKECYVAVQEFLNKFQPDSEDTVSQQLLNDTRQMLNKHVTVTG